MFAFSIKTFFRELKLHSPEVFQQTQCSYDELIKKFPDVMNISVDYAIMEKTKKVAVLPLELIWSDIGSYDSLYEFLPHDDNGNVMIGNMVDIDTKNCFVIGDNKKIISTIGLEDTIVVDTNDALMISKRGMSQKIKNVVDTLKGKKCREVEKHTKVSKPWGEESILDENAEYDIKKMMVNPGENFEVQSLDTGIHVMVLQGIARVLIAEDEMYVHQNQSIYIEKGDSFHVENNEDFILHLLIIRAGSVKIVKKKVRELESVLV